MNIFWRSWPFNTSKQCLNLQSIIRWFYSYWESEISIYKLWDLNSSASIICTIWFYSCCKTSCSTIPASISVVSWIIIKILSIKRIIKECVCRSVIPCILIDVQTNQIKTSFFLSKFQKVEYIQSTWSQYIKTSIIPSNSKWIYMKLSIQDTVENQIYIGSRYWDARFWISWNEHLISYWWNTYNNYSSIYDNIIYEVEMNYKNSRAWKLDWTTKISSLSTLYTNNQPIYIFTWNYNWSFLPAKIKLYSLKLSDWTAITHEFVPVYRKSDSVIWMLDIINKVFYTNNWSWTFSKWSNVPR